MMKRTVAVVARLSVSLLLLAFLSAPALAQSGSSAKANAAASAEGTSKKKKAEIKTGVIASFGNYQGAASVDSAYETEATNDEPAPIQASVTRSGSEECSATVTNADSEHSWSIRYRVIGKRDGRRVMSKSFNSRLKPGESKTHTGIRCTNDMNMAVELRGGKQL